MVGAGIAVLWLGYSVLYWGVSFLQAGKANVPVTGLSFTQVVWPGKWQPAAKKKAA